MKARDWAFPAILIVAALAALAWYFYPKGSEAPVAESAAVVSPPEAPEPSPEPAAPQYPLPDSATPAASADLPTLSASDTVVRKSLTGFLDAASLDALMIPTDIIRRFVAMVDNLPEASLPMRVRLVRKVEGSFAVHKADVLTINPANAARYDRFVAAMQMADPVRVSQFYFHFYPLFQSAYDELGHKGHYFNDRLIQAIDLMLETPVPDEPIPVMPVRGTYQFVDPQLEALTSGQKIMIRMGAKNAMTVKSKLRQVRTALITNGATEPGR